MVENSKPLVIDASIVLAWLLPDESSENADSLFQTIKREGSILIAPSFITLEIVNAVRQAVKRARITEQIALQLLEKLRELPIKLIHPTYLPRQLYKLAAELQLSAYDAAYVWLAINQDAELYTLDEKLAKAASFLHSS